MFLLLWGTFLTVCSQLVSPVVSWLVSLTCSITEYELELRQEIRDMRRELAKTSMQVLYRVITSTLIQGHSSSVVQDQFAVYAKTERKINKLTEKLQSVTTARSVQFSKVRQCSINIA